MPSSSPTKRKTFAPFNGLISDQYVCPVAEDNSPFGQQGVLLPSCAENSDPGYDAHEDSAICPTGSVVCQGNALEWDFAEGDSLTIGHGILLCGTIICDVVGTMDTVTIHIQEYIERKAYGFQVRGAAGSDNYAITALNLIGGGEANYCEWDQPVLDTDIVLTPYNETSLTWNVLDHLAICVTPCHPQPSMSPTESINPSQRPSNLPTLTQQPSATPSDQPSQSQQPSATPSDQPSQSKEPSHTPSSQPSQSKQPSLYPSSRPTQSQQPSATPSNLPTMSAAPTFCTLENLALGKNAVQSSTDFGGNATRAVDGDRTSNYKDGSITHTAESDSPWWYVDLGDAYRVEQVIIWNRLEDCCSERLSFAKVRLLTSLSNEGSDFTSEVTLPDMTGVPNFVWDTSTLMNTDIVGVYIFIPAVDSYLSLAEVEVMGTHINCPVAPSSQPTISAIPSSTPSLSPSLSAKPSAHPSGSPSQSMQPSEFVLKDYSCPAADLALNPFGPSALISPLCTETSDPGFVDPQSSDICPQDSLLCTGSGLDWEFAEGSSLTMGNNILLCGVFVCQVAGTSDSVTIHVQEYIQKSAYGFQIRGATGSDNYAITAVNMAAGNEANYCTFGQPILQSDVVSS